MKLKWLKDKLGEKFYPIAHATGVVVAENKTLDSKLDEIDKSLTKINEDIKDNGYGEVAGGKNLANFSKLGMKTSNGITFEYQSNGSIKVSGTVLNKDDNVYTPLNLTKTRLSKGHWYTASVKSSNPKSIAKLFFTDKGAATTLQVPETADMYYYIQFFDGVEGKIPAGTVINEVLYPQLEEGKVVTEYEPYFPSNKMLMEENSKQSADLTNQQNNGYLQKNLVDYKSLFDDLSDNGEGTTHTYSDGILKISRTANIYSGVYIYSAQITPLQGKELVVSFDAKSTVSTMNLRVYISTGEAPGTTENLTTEYKRYRLDVKAGSTDINLVIYGNDVAGDVWIKNFMITEKYVEDTTYVDRIKSNMELDTYKADKSETTVNLFKPTLESTTVNGIVVTNNGDGTYNVTGTATATTELTLGSVTLTPGIYKNIGATAYIKKTDGSYVKTIHNEEFTITEDSPVVTPILFCNSGEAISGTIIIKPMITTNLNATIDDFVPHTGDTGSLNGDVADLRSSIYFEKEISLSKAQLIRNGSYSDINIISSLFLFGANGKFGLSRGHISLSIPVSFSKKDEIYIKLPYKQYGYKKDDLLPYIYKTVFCTQGDFNGKIIGTCNLSYYSGSDDEGISLTIDINDNYSFTDDNISSAYVDLRF